MIGNLKENYHGGLSGLQLPVPKYQFPKEWERASRLSYYASFFNSIEINSSFYKIPMPRTVTRWAESVPDDFKFTFKLFREITHSKSVDFDDDQLERFFHVIDHVGDKTGCVLVQFPPGFTIDGFIKVEKLANRLRELNAQQRWKICFEFRHSSWYNTSLYLMLAKYHAHLVKHDMPKSATPFSVFESDVVYHRFHGPTGNYRGDYDAGFLIEFAHYVNQWLTERKHVFVYFNNTAGNAFRNLADLNLAISGDKD